MKSLLSSTMNTRELGGFSTPYGMTLTDRIWRSDVPAVFSSEDEQLLISKKMTVIIDLRTDEEVKKVPCVLNRAGFEYHHLPIYEGSVPPSSLEGVPLSYMEIAASDSMAEAFRIISEVHDSVLFHCTAGKDRTGVLSALILLACETDKTDIIYDYALSREYNKVRLMKYLREHPEVDKNIVLANEVSMKSFIEMLMDEYGSLKGYFESRGVPGAYNAVRNKLLPITER